MLLKTKEKSCPGTGHIGRVRTHGCIQIDRDTWVCQGPMPRLHVGGEIKCLSNSAKRMSARSATTPGCPTTKTGPNSRPSAQNAKARLGMVPRETKPKNARYRNVETSSPRNGEFSFADLFTRKRGRESCYSCCVR